ncbi:MAG: hypothetical protein M3Z25_24090 [Actinomycetota bacterium]|nr:hypothetical protein [Actinomycetota bacterium]
MIARPSSDLSELGGNNSPRSGATHQETTRCLHPHAGHWSSCGDDTIEAEVEKLFAEAKALDETEDAEYGSASRSRAAG